MFTEPCASDIEFKAPTTFIYTDRKMDTVVTSADFCSLPKTFFFALSV